MAQSNSAEQNKEIFKMAVGNKSSLSVKYEATAPYHFFLTTVADEPATHNQMYSVSFQEIIDRNLGELIDCFHLTYCPEPDWIIAQYKEADQNSNLTIIYSDIVLCEFCLDCNSQCDHEPHFDYDVPYNIELEKNSKVNYENANLHSNITILKYKDNKIRLTISSGSLNAIDWTIKTQGLWISPFLPLLPDDADDTDGESPTNFKKDFIEYMSEHKEPQVFGWLALLHRTDFSAVKVFFLGSVPGNFGDSKFELWGRNKLGKILLEHAVLPDNAKDWPIVALASIGWIGPTRDKWLNHTLHKMSKEKDKRIIFTPELKVICPSKNNYLQSFDHQYGKIRYLNVQYFHLQQKWIQDDMHHWKSDKTSRSRAMPSINCYTRISPDNTEIPWFLLSSCGLLRCSWGKYWNDLDNPKIYLTRYEAGVLFIPKFLINQNTFPISEETASEAPVFSLPFDVPLTPYQSEDEPYSRPLTSTELAELKEDGKLQES